MRINPIKNITKRDLKIDSKSFNNVALYAKFLSERDKYEYDESEIFTAMLLDKKRLEKMKFTTRTEEKISLKLPEKAWENLDKISEKNSITKEKIIEQLGSSLAKDKKFLGWKKKK